MVTESYADWRDFVLAEADTACVLRLEWPLRKEDDKLTAGESSLTCNNLVTREGRLLNMIAL